MNSPGTVVVFLGIESLHKRLIFRSAVALGIFVAVLGVVVLGLFWRVSQGPVSLAFLTDYVEETVNAALQDTRLEIQDVVLEKDAQSGAPKIRLRRMQLIDSEERTIMQAPRGAISVDGWMGFATGNVTPRSFELIGPEILVRRRQDGSFELGFGNADEQTSLQSGKSDSAPTIKAEPLENASGAEPEENFMAVAGKALAQAVETSPGLDKIESIQVSNATITLDDYRAGTRWRAPRANLVFKRAPYGFALFADTLINSAVQPWRAEIVTTYRRADKSYQISARFFDLVIADIAVRFPALAKFAEFNLPVSGHAEFSVLPDGSIKRATAELTATAGRVDLPKYMSKPLIIDEGLMRVDYSAADDVIRISNSSVFLAGSRAELNGEIIPRRAPDKRISGLDVKMEVVNTDVAANNQVERILPIDKLTLDGGVSFAKARFEIDDLIMHKDDGGARIRGYMAVENEGLGLYLAGRLRDVDYRSIRKLWPPIVAQPTREWLRKNLSSATISNAEFEVNIPADQLLASIRKERLLPRQSMRIRFDARDITTKYFKDLPPIIEAHGTGLITGDTVDLKMDGGAIVLPSGERLAITDGDMHVNRPAVLKSLARIAVRGNSKIGALLQLLDHEPLQLIKKSGLKTTDITGTAEDVDVVFELPFKKGLTRDEVKISATAKLTNAAYPNVTESISLKNGKMALVYTDSDLKVSGPIRLNGVPVNMSWARAFGQSPPKPDTIKVTAELDSKQRRQFGINLDTFLNGKVGVTATGVVQNRTVDNFHVVTDLSRTNLHFDAIGWRRAAGPKAKAEFDIRLKKKQPIAVNNLHVSGQGLKITGNLLVDRKKGLLQGTFPTVALNRFNKFAVAVKSSDNGTLEVVINGNSFDARPLINAAFSRRVTPPKRGASNLRISASITNVHANRGEVIHNVRGTIRSRGDFLERGKLSGVFASGKAIEMEIAPQQSGDRQLIVQTNDGGATLRAVNLYSKVASGSLSFQAQLAPGSQGVIRRGLMIMRNFEIRNEPVVTRIDQLGGDKINTKSRDALRFTQLRLPFSTDQNFVLIGNALAQGVEVGASAKGRIRKSDGALDIGGTFIPAYQINSALSGVPVVGEILFGGRGQGLFGVTFAVRGTIRKPDVLINPVSALAPGIFRQLFGFGGGGVAADGTALTRTQPKPARNEDR